MKRMKKVMALMVIMITLCGCSVVPFGKDKDDKKDTKVSESKKEKGKDKKAEKSEPEPEMFSYVDAQGNRYTAVIDPEVEKHTYDFTKLKHKKKSAKIEYDDGTYTIRKGVDVSHHNGEIDWERVKEQGYEFAIIRLGYRGYGKEGKVNPDKQFQSSFKAARRAGMQLGVYFFSQAINEAEAVEEAEFVLQELNNSKLDLPVVYDPELIPDDDARTDNVTGEQFTKNTIAFCEKIKEAGYEPMVYSNLYWEAKLFDLKQLADYPIWYADYQAAPQTPYRFTIWQYSESGKIPGIHGHADLDVIFEKKKS